MPVRRRKSKAKPGAVRAWVTYFYSGYDFFDDLAAIGLTEETAEPLAEAMWHEIGAEAIDFYADLHRGYSPTGQFWAEEQFGPPGGKRKLQRR